MKVRAKLYAGLKEQAGAAQLILEAVDTGEAVGKIREALKSDEIQVLVNGRNAETLPKGRKLKKRDLLEAFPPVGGG